MGDFGVDVTMNRPWALPFNIAVSEKIILHIIYVYIYILNAYCNNAVSDRCMKIQHRTLIILMFCVYQRSTEHNSEESCKL